MAVRVCSIFEWNEQRQKLIRADSFGRDINEREIWDFDLPQEQYSKYDIGQNITGRFFDEWIKSENQRDVYICYDLFKELEIRGIARPDVLDKYGDIIGEPLENAIYASLGPPDSPLGVLRAINKTVEDEFGERKFSDIDRELFEAAAAQVSLAITNLNLFERYVEASKDKESYLRALTHQLRAPISDVMLLTENMQLPNFPKEYLEKNIRAIQLHTRFFENVIRNFETVVSSAEPPKLDLKPIKLGPIILRCLELLTIKDRTQIPKNLDDMPEIQGDEDRLEQAFMNLLDNARKYSEPKDGPIGIECKWDENSVSVSVTNIGPHINAIDRERILKLGEKAEAARDRITGGAGIGLPAVIIVMSQHKGKLDIMSIPISASTARNEFIITLPRG